MERKNASRNLSCHELNDTVDSTNTTAKNVINIEGPGPGSSTARRHRQRRFPRTGRRPRHLLVLPSPPEHALPSSAVSVSAAGSCS
jgi:hypothetical protein